MIKNAKIEDVIKNFYVRILLIKLLIKLINTYKFNKNHFQSYLNYFKANKIMLSKLIIEKYVFKFRVTVEKLKILKI